MSVDPQTAIAVFELIQKTVTIGGQINDLVNRVKAGETIPIEEIKADRAEVNAKADEFAAACEGDE